MNLFGTAAPATAAPVSGWAGFSQLVQSVGGAIAQVKAADSSSGQVGSGAVIKTSAAVQPAGAQFTIGGFDVVTIVLILAGGYLAFKLLRK